MTRIDGSKSIRDLIRHRESMRHHRRSIRESVRRSAQVRALYLRAQVLDLVVVTPEEIGVLRGWVEELEASGVDIPGWLHRWLLDR